MSDHVAFPPRDYGAWPRAFCARRRSIYRHCCHRFDAPWNRAGLFVAGTLICGLMLCAGVTVTAAALSGALPLAEPSRGSPATHVLTWNVTAGEAAPMLGRPPLQVLLLNGAWRGPTVEATEGDTLRLTLCNEQPEPVSLHFHGLHQRGTPRADGAARASTTALRDGACGTWDFTAAPPGTHFYHAHAGLTAAQGLHGAVVVRPRSGAPPGGDVADVAPMLFSDCWAAPLASLRDGLLRRDAAFAWVGNPDALLLNGADISLAAGAVVDVTSAAATLRLRLVSGAALSFLNVAFLGHNVTVVEADGAPLRPFDTPAVDLNAGERLTLLMTPSPAARAARVVWMAVVSRHRAGAPVGRIALRLPPLDGGASAAAATTSSPPDVPLAVQPSWNDTDATVAFYRRFVAADGVPPAPVADATAQPRVLLGTQNRVGGLMRWSVNNVTFVFPGDPLLAAAVSQHGSTGGGGDLDPVASDDAAALPPMVDVAAAAARGDAAAAAAQAAWVSPRATDAPPGGAPNASRFARTMAASMGTHVAVLRAGAVVDIVLQNAPALNGVLEQHPWHMHGGAFWILAWGLGDWPGVAAAAALQQAPPPRKDTVTRPPGGWVWLRLVADNPGVWPLHCHILWHLAMGMAAQLVVAPADIPPPQ